VIYLPSFENFIQSIFSMILQLIAKNAFKNTFALHLFVQKWIPQ
jgi:hypothetical protein